MDHLPVIRAAKVKNSVARRTLIPTTAVSLNSQRRPNTSFLFHHPIPPLTAKMGGLESGLEVLCYLYPVGLIVTLYSSQLISYWPRRIGKTGSAGDRTVKPVGRVYAALLWCLQLLLALALVCILLCISETDPLLPG